MPQVCVKCGDELPLDEEHFQPRPDSKTGFRGACRKCVSGQKKDWRGANAARLTEYERNRPDYMERIAHNREYRAAHPEKCSIAKAAWIARNRLKRKAHQAVHVAVRDGYLIKQPCEVCSEEAEAHHDDYSKPLEVRWLCDRHHKDHHKQVREQERKDNGASHSL